MNQHSENILFIVSAPSGTGKTSLCSEVLSKIPNLRFSTSHTTRTPRAGEQEGIDYHFVSPEQFKQYIADNKMAEWAEIYGNYYGTATETIRQLSDSGYDILFDIDEQGARQLTSKYPGSVTILILPPTLEELTKRLKERGTDAPDSIMERLKKAQAEIAAMSWYQYVVINDQFEEAGDKLASIIIAERCRRNHSIIESILKNGKQSSG
jgi:guanylate kinase